MSVEVKNLPNLPSGKVAQTIIEYEEKLIIFGGGDKFGTNHQSYEFNIWTNEYKIKQSLNFQRYYHTANLYKNNLYIYGGFWNTGWNFRRRSFFSIDLKENYKRKNIQTKNLPAPRAQHTSNIYKDKMIIFGGAKEHELSNELFEYDFKTKEWKKIKSENETTKRRGHGSVIFKEKLYIFGGVINEDEILIYSNPSCFDFNTLKWREIDLNFYVAGIGSSTVLWNNSILSFGGFENKERNDLFIFDLKSEILQIKSIEQLKGRSWGSGCLLKNSYYFCGGECK